MMVTFLQAKYQYCFIIEFKKIEELDQNLLNDYRFKMVRLLTLYLRGL